MKNWIWIFVSLFLCNTMWPEFPISEKQAKVPAEGKKAIFSANNQETSSGVLISRTLKKSKKEKPKSPVNV